MRLTIFGASGGIGRQLVAQAAARGHRVRAVSRRPIEVPSGAENVVAVELTDACRLAAMTRGSDAIFSALGLRRERPANPWSPLTSPPDLNARFARAIVQSCGHRCRLIVVSAAGVGDSRDRVSGPMRWLIDRSTLRLAYRDLAEMERVLRGSLSDWTAVRPVTLTDGVGEPTRVREIGRHGLTTRIARADVAAYMLDLAEGRQRPSSRTPMIGRA